MIRKTFRADFTLLVIAISWGSTFTVTKGALKAIGPLAFVTWRFALASVVYFAFFGKAALPRGTREWRSGILLGLTLGFAFLFQTVGLATSTAAKAGFITGLNMILVPPLQRALLKKSVTLQEWIGAALSLVGLGFLTLNQAFFLSPGDAWLVACAFAVALQVIAVDSFGNAWDPIRLTGVELIVTALLGAVGSLAWEVKSLPFPTRDTWLALLYTGALVSPWSFVAQLKAQPNTSATRGALVLGTESGFAALFGWWFAGERFTPQEWLGCVLIAVGIIVAMTRPKPTAVPSV